MGSMAVLNNGVPLENGHSKKPGPEKTVTKRAEAIYNSEESRTRYEAYSRLQASAVAFGEKLPIPEIVAVGGQSDGKSSLLEALLGFRFNVREVEMGTRRPLMLQMIHDPSALEPRCRLQDEYSDEYGPVISPVSAVADAIRLRTEEFLKTLGTAVSAKPIVMRAEYAFCPNLTIIDTPGFVLKAKRGEPDNTPDEIEAMVRQLAAPKHRLLLFLQQSSVEWCSSLWLDVVKSIDPTFQRTMVVVSKFDNRLQEFSERWEVDRYLSAGGYLGENARPFFVALPKERSVCTNEDFRRQIAVVDTEILRQLREKVSGGFDEEKFGNHVGFGNLRIFLEAELQRRYRDAAPETLLLLDQRCMQVTAELAVAEAKINAAADVTALRKASMMYTWSISRNTAELLDGVDSPDPAKWGLTSQEERSESALIRWPGQVEDVEPQNANLRLYGGAAFERVLHEYKCVVCSMESPPVSEEQVASILQAHSSRRGGPVFVLAKSAAQAWLSPLLDTVCERLVFILRNLYKLAAERILNEECSKDAIHRSAQNLSVYVDFHCNLGKAHDRFIRKIAARAKDLVKHQLSAIISSFFDVCSNEYNTHLTSFRRGIFAAAGKSRFHIEDTEELLVHSKREDEDEDEGFPQHQEKRQARRFQSPGRGQVESKSGIRDSQITVPETPTPEQVSAEVKRKEFALASGRLSVLGDGAQLAVESGLERKRKRNKRRNSIGKELKLAAAATTHVATGSSVYKEVCAMSAEVFGKIRHMLVMQTMNTLKEAFLDPFSRDELSIEVATELFAVSDEQFLKMFVAPGAIENLESERQSLLKRSTTLQTCLNEFRRLAWSL